MQELTTSIELETDIVDEINNRIQDLEELRWVRRTNLGRGRGIVDSADCAYDFLGDKQMPKELKDFLESVAPKAGIFGLKEICINRYRKGDYIGPHKDKDLYIKNIVISLQDSSDGLYVNDTDEFIKDKKGQAVWFTGVGPTHSVPPVKEERHVLIYLYE